MASFVLSKVSESIGHIDRILHSTIKNPSSKTLLSSEFETERQGKPIWGLDLNYAANNLMAMAEPRADAAAGAVNRIVNEPNVNGGDHDNNSGGGGEGCSYPAASPECLSSTEMKQSRGPLHETDASIPAPRSQSPCTPLHVDTAQSVQVDSEKPTCHGNVPVSKTTPSHAKANETPKGNCPARLSTYLMRHHPSHHLLFNVSSTLPSLRTKFLLDNQIVNLPWKCAGVTAQSQFKSTPENNADKLPDCPTAASIPTLTCLLDICYAMDAYLKLDAKNTAVVYCSNGKTRTGIVIAAYLRYTNKASTTFQGFRTFCARTFRDLISLEQIDALIPPSLKTLFWNFDALLESGGAIQKEKMNLMAVTLQGVPVDDMPRLDIWDGNGLVYSSHISSGDDGSSGEVKGVVDTMDSENSAVHTMGADSNRKSVMWADEEGFYKVNKPLCGDFLLLCRFGGQFAQDTADPTKVILRYANNTAFLFPGPCELPKIKVDTMRRYTDSISEEDFLITFLFERGSKTSTPESQATKANGGLGEWNYLPDLLEGKSAVERGWSVISEYHCVSLGSVRSNGDTCYDESNKIETSLAVLQNYYHGEVGAVSASVASPNLLLLSLAVQLSNNSLRRSVDEFLEDRMKKLWKDTSHPFLFSLPLREDYEIGNIDSPPSLPALEEEGNGDSKEDGGCAHLAIPAKSYIHHHNSEIISVFDEEFEQDEHFSFLDILNDIDFGLDTEPNNVSRQNIVESNHIDCSKRLSVNDDVIQGICTRNSGVNTDVNNPPDATESKDGCTIPPTLSQMILCNPITSPSNGDITSYFSDVKIALSHENSLSDDCRQVPKVITLSHVTRPKLKLHNYKRNKKRRRDDTNTHSATIDTSKGKRRKGMESECNYPLLDYLCTSAITLLEPYAINEGIDLNKSRQRLQFGTNDTRSRVEYDDFYRLVLSDIYNGTNKSTAYCQAIFNPDAITTTLLKDNRETALSMMMQINHTNVRVDDLVGLLRDSKEVGQSDSQMSGNLSVTFKDNDNNKNHDNILESVTKNVGQCDSKITIDSKEVGQSESQLSGNGPVTLKDNDANKNHDNILGSVKKNVGQCDSKINEEDPAAVEDSVGNTCNENIPRRANVQHIDSNLLQRNEKEKTIPINNAVNSEVIKLSGMRSPLAVFGSGLTGLGNHKIAKLPCLKHNYFAKRGNSTYGNSKCVELGNDHVPLGTKVPLVILGSTVEKSGQVIGKDSGFYTVQIPADAFINGEMVITNKSAAAAAADAAAKALFERNGSLVPSSGQDNEKEPHSEIRPSFGGVTAATIIAKAKEEKKIKHPALKDDPEYAKYIKMLKTGLPLDDVKHAMNEDGKDPNIIDGDHNKPVPVSIVLKEDPEFAKYFKMVDMGLTIDSVKQSMERDDKDPRIIDLNPNKPLKMQTLTKSVDNESESKEEDNSKCGEDIKSDSPPLKEEKDDGPPLKEDPEYVKYFKMLKMGLPIGAVKNAIERDDKNPAIMDLDPEKSLKSQLKSGDDDEEEDTGPPLKEDPEYVKYFKMLKMGLPIGAVKNAIERDGKDGSVMDLDPEKSLKSQLKSGDDNDDDDETGPPLKEDPEYGKYFKMLKMGLPIGAVKNSIERDDKNPAIMDLDPDKSLKSQTKKKKAKAKIKPKKKKAKVVKAKVRRKKIYWNAVDTSKIGRDSIWGNMHGMFNMDQLVNDTSEFETLFTETLDPSLKKKSKEACKDPSAKKAKKSVQIVDGKRAMNGGIILARLKMNFTDLANIINCMSRGKFDSVQLIALSNFLPTDEEGEGLKLYLSKATTEEAKEAAIADLGACEKYMVAMMEVTNSCDKFSCLVFESQFQSRMEEITESIAILTKACDDVKESTRLRKLMQVILELGNKINTGGTGNVANGFTLDALLKLNEAKAFDRKTSVLQYLVRILKPFDKELLNFKEDIVSSIKAENVMLDTLSTDIKNFSEEFETIKIIATADGESRRGEDGKILNLNTKISLTELKEQKSSVREVNGVKFYNQMELIVEYTPMEIFFESAEKKIHDACNQVDETKKKFVALLEYFGEDDKMTSTDFFGTLNKFTESFKVAKDYVDKQEEMKLKEEKRAANEAKKLAAKQARDAKLQRQDNGDSDTASSVLPSISSTGNNRIKRRGSGDSESTFGISSQVRDILKEESNSATERPNDAESMRNTFHKVDGESLNPLVKPIAERSILHFVANATLNKKNQDTLKESELSSKIIVIENSQISAEVDANNVVVHPINPLAVELTNSTSEQTNAKVKRALRKLNTSYNPTLSEQKSDTEYDVSTQTVKKDNAHCVAEVNENNTDKLNTSYNPTLPEQNSDTEYDVSTQTVKKYNTHCVAEVNENNTDKHITNPVTDTPSNNASTRVSVADAADNAATKRKSQSPEKDDANNTNNAAAQSKRKSQNAVKRDGNSAAKPTNRQVVAAGVVAAKRQADAEAAWRRNIPNPAAFTGIPSNNLLTPGGIAPPVAKVEMDRNTSNASMESCDKTNELPRQTNSLAGGGIAATVAKSAMKRNASHGGVQRPSTGSKPQTSKNKNIAQRPSTAEVAKKNKPHSSAKSGRGKTEKRQTNPFAGGGIAAEAAQATANSNTQSTGKSMKTKAEKRQSNPFAGGGIAAQAAQAAEKRNAPPTNPLPGGGIAVQAAQAAAKRNAQSSKESITHTFVDPPTNPLAGRGIAAQAAQAAQAAANRKIQSSAEGGVSNTSKIPSNPFAGRGIAAQAAQVAANRRTKSSAEDALSKISTISPNLITTGGIAAQAAANRKTQSSAEDGLSNTSKSSSDTSAGAGIAGQAAANRKTQSSAEDGLSNTSKSSSHPSAGRGIAAQAAQAAQAAANRRTKSSAEGDESNTSKNSSDLSVERGIAAQAAANRKTQSSAEDDSSNASKSSSDPSDGGGIAAQAAANRKTQSSDEGGVSNTSKNLSDPSARGGIAAQAAADRSTESSAEGDVSNTSNSSSDPSAGGGIAAQATANRRTKSSAEDDKMNTSKSSSNASAGRGIAAQAAANRKTQSSDEGDVSDTSKSLSNPFARGGIAAQAAQAAQAVANRRTKRSAEDNVINTSKSSSDPSARGGIT